MARKLQNLKIDQVALVDKGANQLADVVLFKRKQDDVPGEPATVTTGTGTVPLTKGAESMPDTKDTAAIEKELAEARSELQRIKAELAETPVAPESVEFVKAEYAKTLAETEKAREELRKQLEAAQSELEESRAEVLKIRAARRREKFIKMVQTLPSLPGVNADDFGEILDTIEQHVTEKQFNKLVALLTSWNAVIGKSKVFEELGRAGDGPLALQGPEGRLATIARDIQAAEPKLSYPQAYAKALQQHPDLYRQYVAERRA
jgi:uncharacterized phage infection (PIP) family protein YhgE